MIVDDKQFDVEHALGMYATSFVTIPAEAIYDLEFLKQFEAIVATCHIYVYRTLCPGSTLSRRDRRAGN